LGPAVVVPAVDWAGELGMRQTLNKPAEISWFPPPPAGAKVSFMTLFAPNCTAEISRVSLQTDLYVTEPLRLENGECVWLLARYEPLGLGEPEHMEALAREFPVFNAGGKPSDTSAAGIEVFTELPLVIQFPLGKRHFVFKA